MCLHLLLHLSLQEHSIWKQWYFLSNVTIFLVWIFVLQCCNSFRNQRKLPPCGMPPFSQDKASVCAAAGTHLRAGPAPGLPVVCWQGLQSKHVCTLPVPPVHHARGLSPHVHTMPPCGSSLLFHVLHWYSGFHTKHKYREKIKNLMTEKQSIKLSTSKGLVHIAQTVCPQSRPWVGLISRQWNSV